VSWKGPRTRRREPHKIYGAADAGHKALQAFEEDQQIIWEPASQWQNVALGPI
jgi:hypothetical protein